MTDFRALCEELADNLHRYQSWYIEDNGYGLHDLEALLRRTHTALAEQQVRPTDEEIRTLCAELLKWAEHTSNHFWYFMQADVIIFARALLAQSEPIPEVPTDEEIGETELEALPND